MAKKTFLQDYKENVKAFALFIFEIAKVLVIFFAGAAMLLSLLYGTGWLYAKGHYVCFAAAIVGWLLAGVALVTFFMRMPAIKSDPYEFDID